MSLAVAETRCHPLARSRTEWIAGGSSAEHRRRRSRATVMLAVFGFVLMQTLIVCHSPATTTDRSVEALIASAFCSTSPQSAPVGSPLNAPINAPTHAAPVLCFHCASGCHGVLGATTFWMVIAFGIAAAPIMRINLDTMRSTSHHRDYRVRGPPAG